MPAIAGVIILSKSYWVRLLGAALVFGAGCTTTVLAFEPDDPRYWETPEYWNLWGLGETWASGAYALGLDGSGVKVGVVDSGIDPTHPEFLGQLLGGYDFVGNTSILSDYVGHGTGVASLIAGRRDGVGMHGMAPGASIVSAAIFDAAGETNDGRIAAAWDYLLNDGVRIINNSWGQYDLKITDVTAGEVARDWSVLLAAARDAVAHDALIVFITHNGEQTEANLESGLPHYFPELERGWIAVTGGPDYDGIANWCGVAKYWCLAAPANMLLAARPGGGYDYESGTSMAAPLVAGAAALVWQAFPWMSTDQVRQVLLGTAYDINGDGVDDRYGYGELDVFSAVLGPGKFDWGDFHAVQPSGFSSWYNAISGDGGLVKSGNGQLILRRDNTYTGATRIDGGQLILEGSITSPTFIDAGGELAGDGTIFGDVENRGVFLPGWGQGGGIMTIDGDYSQFADASLRVYVGGAFGTSLAEIYGTATMGGTVDARVLAGGYSGDTEHEILWADAGLAGQFEDVLDNMAFLDTQLRADANSVYLAVMRNAASFASLAASANGRGAAGAIEGLGVGNALFDAVVTLGNAEAGGAFDALAGSEQASVASILAVTGGGVSAMATDRLRSAFGSAGAVKVPVMSYAPTGTPLMVSMDYQGPSFWTSTQAAWGSGGPMSSFTAGQLVGVDAPFGDWRAGALVGFGKTSARSQNANVDGTDYHVGLYGGTQWGDIALRTGASYSRHTFETSRTVNLSGSGQTLTSSYGGNTAQAFAEIGYGIEAGSLRFEPFAGLAHMNIWTEGFAETGGSAALSGNGTSLSTTFATLGVNAQAPVLIGETEATVRGALGWRHTLGADAPISTQAFSGSGSFDVAGAPLDRNAVLVEAGVDLPLSDSARLGLTYGGQIAENSRSHGVKAELRVSF